MADLRVTRSLILGGREHHPGDSLEGVSEEQAAELVRKGLCEPAEPAKPKAAAKRAKKADPPSEEG